MTHTVTSSSNDAADRHQLLVELQFAVRDRVGDFLASPSSRGLEELRATLKAFLDIELERLLDHPEDDAPGDLAGLLHSRDELKEAMRQVVWTDSSRLDVLRAAEALRLAFLAHVHAYVMA